MNGFDKQNKHKEKEMGAVKAKVRRRGMFWKNTKLKKFKKWLAQGSYNVKRGDRYFVLTNKSGATRTFESPDMAKAEGWSHA